MKKFNIIVGLTFVGILKAFSQNSTVVMAPKNITIGLSAISNTNLPIAPAPLNSPYDPYDYYDGWRALQGSNGISDVTTGALKFFIIDGAIYNGADGQYKDYAWSASQPNVQTIGNFNQPEGDGGSEQLIVPHPVNCNQYYIFAVATFWNGDTGQKSLPGYPSSVPVYALYDAELGLVINRGVWYNPTPSFLGLTISNPIFTSSTTANPLNTNGDPQVTATVWNGDCNMSTASIAGSKLLSDGTRIIACKMKNNLYSIKILADGTLRYWKRYNHSAIISGSQTRAEFEMVFDGVSNRFKLAFESRNGLGSAYTYCVKYFELSADFLTQLNFQTINVPVVGNGSSAVKPIAGIEFSPNKNIIYFTCTTDLLITAQNPQPVSQRVYTINLTNNLYTVSPFAISQTRQNKIQNGYIELALDGNLYFASATGLFRLTNPNTPLVSNFSANPIISFIYSSNLGVNTLGSSFVSNSYLDSYTLPGQIDGANYSDEYFKNTECCINVSPFDASAFTATTSGTWTPGGFLSNPFGSTNGIVRIETSITIPAGVNITITGMTFQFAPGARIIIREGNSLSSNGGKLTLNNSVLTNYQGCTKTMWHGVEVWGVSSTSQGSLASSRQGRLIMQNNARIENALFGAAARATNVSSGAELVGKYGGIVHATNSTFLNNKYDVLLYDYGTALVNNISMFTNCVFKTEGLLNDPTVSIVLHMMLRSVRGVRVFDCDFINADLSFYPLPTSQGIGIGAINSSFSVDGCTNYSTSCNPSNLNTFENLFVGIYSGTSGSNASFRADGNLFQNNCIGIYVNGTRSEQITRNKFNVREFLTASPISQSAGIYTVGSTGYRIEDNSFKESNDLVISYGVGSTYGVVINNSGPNENVVYRNTFKDLLIGCQSEGVNGSAPMQFPGMSNVGLVWRCNEFYKPIYKNDITSFNGKIKYRQGFYNPNNTPMQNQLNMANNRFSLSLEATTDPEHDFKISPVVGQNGIIYTGYDQVLYNLDAYTTPIISQTIISTTFLPQVGCKSNFGAGSIASKDEPVSSEMMELMNNSILSLRTEDSLSDTELSLLEIGAKQLEKNLRVQEILFDTIAVNVDSVLIDYLSQFDDEESLKMLAELQLAGSDVDSLVASLETDSVKFSIDYVDLLKIKAAMLNSEYFYSFLINNENSAYYRTRLSEIAANEDDVLTAHQAALLLSFAKPLDLTYHFLEAEKGGEKSMQIPTSNTDSKSNLIVYPNPVKSTLSINLALAENEQVSATIFSILGNTMGTWQLSNENNAIDVNHFQGGVYLIHVNNAQGENIQTLRFVKQ
jgi:hypothetical protein